MYAQLTISFDQSSAITSLEMVTFTPAVAKTPTRSRSIAMTDSSRADDAFGAPMTRSPRPKCLTIPGSESAVAT